MRAGVCLVVFALIASGCSGSTSAPTASATGGGTSGSTGATAGSTGAGGSAGAGGSTGAGGSVGGEGGPGREAFHVIDPVPSHSRLSPTAFDRTTYIQSVSRDGSVVIGLSSARGRVDATAGQEGEEALRWTEATGSVGLGFLPECDQGDPGRSQATAVASSSDGSVVFGDCRAAMSNSLFRWTQASGMVKVDAPPNLPDAAWAQPSSDGRVGFVNAAPAFGDTLHVPEGFRWTQTSGAVAIGVPGAKGRQIHAVTPDGGTVFGVTFDASGSDLFRWTEAGGTITVPRLVGYDSCVPEARAMSADGKVILGTCSGPSGKQVFRWTEASGMQPLAPPQGTVDDGAHALTPDGAAIVGFSHDAASSQAFRWTERTGMTRLGVLPGYEWSSTGSSNQLSDDGAIVIGACSGHWDGGLPQRLGFRWTEASGMVALGALPGSNGSNAENISADGSVIAGESLVLSLDPVQQPPIAVYWDAGGNVTSLATALAGAGVDLQGFKLEYAHVSPSDGHLFWGIGSTREGERRGWIARVP